MAGTGPTGRVVIETAGASVALDRFADAVEADLRDAGIWVETEARIPTADPASARPGTEVLYGWRPDVGLAQAVASLLPGMPGGTARFEPASDLAPGEVRVRFASGG